MDVLWIDLHYQSNNTFLFYSAGIYLYLPGSPGTFWSNAGHLNILILTLNHQCAMTYICTTTIARSCLQRRTLSFNQHEKQRQMNMKYKETSKLQISSTIRNNHQYLRLKGAHESAYHTTPHTHRNVYTNGLLNTVSVSSQLTFSTLSYHLIKVMVVRV